MFTRFDATKSTKGASKLRRDLINAEIANLRELLPLPPSTRQRLSQLQLMALVCVYVRKANYFQQAFKCHHDLHHHHHHHHHHHQQQQQQPSTTPNIGFSKALSGFLMMMTQNGKLLYISDNAAEYLGHSMEDLLIHGDSVYDIIDKQDHQAIQCELGRPVNTDHAISSNNNNNIASGGTGDEVRLFLCRMNVSRNARRQMRFGDQKVVLVQGRYLSFLPLCSRNEPVFLATCTPVAMPETRECVVQGATNVFTSIHSMDMRYMHIDTNGEFYLGFARDELQGVSWYRLLHWESTREAQTKHRLITQSEQERSCILLAQFQCRTGEWLWMHCVLQVKESAAEGGQQQQQQAVIVCTNQVLSEPEAAVMRTNAWLYHYYSVQNKLQYGLAAYDVAGTPPAARLLTYYPEHNEGGEYASHAQSQHDAVYPMPHHPQQPQPPPQQQTHHQAPPQHHQHHQYTWHRPEAEPVDYSSYSKRTRPPPTGKSNEVVDEDVEMHSGEEQQYTILGGGGGGGGGGLLVVAPRSRVSSRTALKTDPSELMDQWNPSPPWSDTLQKVPDLCQQELLSPYVGSTPPTPTATPGGGGGGGNGGALHPPAAAFTFDWTPEQYVPAPCITPTPSAPPIQHLQPLPPPATQHHYNYWPPEAEHRLFPLQPPPKKRPSSPSSSSAERDTPS